MSVEISIGNELGSLTVSLGEFVAVIKDLAGAAKEREVRKALGEMITKVRISYDTVVDAFTPLYELDNQRKFTSRFSKIRTDFKNTYLKNIGKIRTHCSIVETRLKELRKRKSWLNKLPIAKRSFQRLIDLSENWIANDVWLANNMENLVTSINSFLNQIYDLQKKNKKHAYSYLNSTLE